MSGHSDPKILQILALHSHGDFQGIIDLLQRVANSNIKTDKKDIHLVTWPLPTLDHLKDFADFLASRGVGKVFSIGCGSGLLEWLILQVSASHANHHVDFVGVEIDSRWWTSTYSPPLFVPLRYVGEDFIHTQPFGDPGDLAVFCYFNNLPVFQEYLEAFRGRFVVLIGPISNTQFCAPAPRELAENKHLPIHQWKLVSCTQFGFVDIDHIAIYERTD